MKRVLAGCFCYNPVPVRRQASVYKYWIAKRKGRVVAVKFFCPKCGRRFVEWGAEKLEFKCPTEGCEQEQLLALGSNELDLEDKSKIKRPKKSKSIVPLVNPEDDVSGLEDGFIDDADADLDDEEEELEEEEEEVVAPVAAVVVDTEILDDDADDDDAGDAGDDDTFAEALELDTDLTVDED